MRHINEILKPGANLSAIKLDPNCPKIKSLIDQTAKEQDKIIARQKRNNSNLLNTYITI